MLLLEDLKDDFVVLASAQALNILIAMGEGRREGARMVRHFRNADLIVGANLVIIEELR